MKNRFEDWSFLKQFTHARVSIGRAGVSVPTREWLDFKSAHSRARESVWREVDFSLILKPLTLLSSSVLQVQSQCESKKEFLLNPEKGKLLNDHSKKQVSKESESREPSDCVVVIGDGLSADAIHKNAMTFLEVFLNRMSKTGLSLGPIVLARYARVALGDEIGSLLKTKTVLVLIGERPGLATSESLSVYFTYQPQSNKTDAERNCISNIHSEGLAPDAAARMAIYLLEQSLKLKLSGVSLKLEYSTKNILSP